MGNIEILDQWIKEWDTVEYNCKWIPEDKAPLRSVFSGWITDCGHITSQRLDYKYCPYCGRRIKFEE